ncbi:MAG: PQQ-dependent sugar dehydrogenase [Chthonomonas sp.]|nr:PQQ-dependent sugar dehydrogenase [Chthonomonas sp.]
MSAAQTVSPAYTGLARPVVVAYAPNDSRMFIVEQRSSTVGRIRVVVNGSLQATPYLSINGVATGSEQGLLGVCFDPNFATNGFLYVNYTQADGTTRIVRYKQSVASPNTADPASAFNIMQLAQPFSNHNSGSLKFGSDGFMWIPTGDGGSGNDPGDRAQTKTNLLGKILRIDVSGDDYPADTTKNYRIPAGNAGAGFAPEVWSYGWRNPWQFDFDRVERGGFGGLFVADVGQNAWEEISFERAGAPAGLNYGWRIREGMHNTGLGGVGVAPFVDPIYEYDHGMGLSISGGSLYRGVKMGPANWSRYFFADYITAELWSVKITFDANLNATASDFMNHGTAGNMTSIMPDGNAELFAGTVSGSVLALSGSGRGVSGVVTLGDLSVAGQKARRVTFQVKDMTTGTTYPIDYNLPASGAFRIPATENMTEVSLKVSHWLNKKIVIMPGTANLTGQDMTLLNGDVNTTDNLVDIADYSILAGAFDAAVGDPGYVANADLNEDGIIDIADYTILATNFDVVGD